MPTYWNENAMEEVISAFKSLDKEGNGKIAVSDLKQILTHLGDKFEDEEFDSMITAAGGGSKLDYEKFVKMMHEKAHNPDEGEDDEE